MQISYEHNQIKKRKIDLLIKNKINCYHLQNRYSLRRLEHWSSRAGRKYYAKELCTVYTIKLIIEKKTYQIEKSIVKEQWTL